LFETNRIAVYKALYRIIGGFMPDVVAACDQVVLKTFVVVVRASNWSGLGNGDCLNACVL
jgi:hypothetical protein